MKGLLCFTAIAVSTLSIGCSGSDDVPSDPETTDPAWPGILPLSSSPFEFVINIRFDGYAAETSWVLSQLVTNVENIDRNVASDEWIVVDSYGGGFSDGGELLNFRQFRSPEAIYHFSITDDFSDGICCTYGFGWVTLTNRTGVLWSLPGDTFTDIADVYFWMDEEGNTMIIDPPNDIQIPNTITEADLVNLTFLPDFTLDTLNNTANSPQEEGLLWLLAHPDYPSMPDWRKQQVFAFATFLYSVNAPQLLNTSISECEWFDEFSYGYDACDSEGRLQRLQDNYSHSLAGSIPPEISLLTSLTDIDLAVNDLTGSLPKELFLLPALSDLWIGFNKLSGSLPSELGLLTTLTTLYIRDNSFTGTIPDEITKLANLGYVNFAGNLFEGKLPVGICHASLYSITVDCTRLSCPCDECECE